MTGSEDSNASTRPISVAELLARNGTIGAPPAGGRRRRRRGDTGTITVAELTGEIPVVTDEPKTDAPPAGTTAGRTGVEANGSVDTASAEVSGPVQVTRPEPATRPEPGAAADTGPATARSAPPGGAEQAPTERGPAEKVPAEKAPGGKGAADPEPEIGFIAPPRRSGFAARRSASTVEAEEMSPDPFVDDATDRNGDAGPVTAADRDSAADDDLAGYLSDDGPLFGSRTVTDDLDADTRDEEDDLARDLDEDDDLDDELDDELEGAHGGMSTVVHAAWVVGQCVLAVALGAGLFLAFDQLWNWNSILALLLGVLVILGLVAGVRVVRKTEDIGSTLIAVAVGALVTFGPLALMRAG